MDAKPPSSSCTIGPDPWKDEEEEEEEEEEEVGLIKEAGLVNNQTDTLDTINVHALQRCPMLTD